MESLELPDTHEKTVAGGQKTQTLGTIQLRNDQTNEVILVPTPSNDPNDPLNWSVVQKNYVFALVCIGIFMVNFVAVGPSVALETITIDYFGDGPDLLGNLSKTAYLQTACSLMIGVGNLIWVPMAIKYGRRPVYVISFLLMTGSTIWCGAAKTFPSALAGRIILGFASAAPEIVAPLTLTDIFFLHQRGVVMVIYTCALSCGVGAGVVISGFITMHHSWRVIYWVSTALIGLITVLVISTFPESHFNRQEAVAQVGLLTSPIATDTQKPGIYAEEIETQPEVALPERKTFLQSMALYSGVYTEENLFVLMFRPLVALALPAVFWATLINSVTIGMIVVLSANFSSAFATIYGFQPWQAGLTFVSAITGSLIAILLGGHLSDWVANQLTIRNGGVRTPEMRLPALVISLVTGPLSCILYGVGFGKRLHWMCAVIGIGLVNFTVVQSNNIGLVYILDSYRPIAGEVVVTQSVFKAVFGFLLSFHTNSWIQESGYILVFGSLAAVSASVFLLMIPFYLWGKHIRHWSWKLKFVKVTLHWNTDREVGE